MNKIISNSDEFLSIYNEVDKYMRVRLNIDDIESYSSLVKRMANKNRLFFRYKEHLDSYGRLRDAIVHNPHKKEAEPIAEPHDFVVERFRRLKEFVINPPIALDTIAVRAESVYKTSMDALALDVMRTMSEKVYTHVPIINNDGCIN